MPRIFWTVKRKKRLVKQAKILTIAQLAKKHFKPQAEIVRMLRQLSPDNPLIKEIRREGQIKITVFYPGYADGVRQQPIGSQHALY